jgi:2'-5' RNA ligase
VGNPLGDDEIHTLGVAIAVPEPWGSTLQDRRSSYGDGLAYTIPTHITLLPPTQVPHPRLPTVDEHLAAIARDEEPFTVQLRSTGTFRPVTPTVFTVLAQGVGGCERLERRVRSGPLRRRLPFPYHPHVTLAFDVDDKALDRAFEEFAEFDATFIATGFTRYALGEDGIWEAVRDFQLGR